jgi:exopolysaccharide production protein ExoF
VAVTNPKARYALQLSLALCVVLAVPLLMMFAPLDRLPFISADPLADLVSRTEGKPLVAIDTQARRAANNTPQQSLVAFTGDGSSLIVYGDRLKITFFETLQVSLGTNGTGEAETTAFPRMDLSGEYTVDEAGSVNIPVLGQFVAADEPAPALQSKLAAAFGHSIGRAGDAHVAIVERQPVYVLGTVRNAGTYKHTPGMILLQALAAAGGVHADITDTSQAIEGIREAERLRQSQQRLDRLLVTQARLVAQRDNAGSMQLPQNILTKLAVAAEHDRMNALVTDETVTLANGRRSYQQQVSLADRQVRIAQAELGAQNARADQLKDLRSQTENRLDQLQRIAARGSVSQYALADAGVKLAELAARQEDLKIAIAQAERGVVVAEAVRARLEVDYAAGLERDLIATQREIDDCTHAIASMRAVTELLGDGIRRVKGGTVFSITRRTAENVAIIYGNEDTPLLPGDVVRVGSSDLSPTRTSGIAPDPLHFENRLEPVDDVSSSIAHRTIPRPTIGRAR